MLLWCVGWQEGERLGAVEVVLVLAAGVAHVEVLVAAAGGDAVREQPEEEQVVLLPQVVAELRCCCLSGAAANCLSATAPGAATCGRLSHWAVCVLLCPLLVAGRRCCVGRVRGAD